MRTRTQTSRGSHLLSTDIYAARWNPIHPALQEVKRKANERACRVLDEKIHRQATVVADFGQRTFDSNLLAQAIITDADLLQQLDSISGRAEARANEQRLLIITQIDRHIRSQIGWTPTALNSDITKAKGVMDHFNDAKASDDDVQINWDIDSYLAMVGYDLLADRAHGLPERPVLTQMFRSLKQLFIRR